MIKNKTKKFKIIDKTKLCKSVFCKGFGLMFRVRKPDFGMVFLFGTERRADLHMMFVFFPIDVIFLDKNKKVVDIKKNFKPFSYYAPKEKAEFVIELPVGVMGKTKIGDEISF